MFSIRYVFIVDITDYIDLNKLENLTHLPPILDDDYLRKMDNVK